MKIYVTKYALTRGIFTIEAELTNQDRYASEIPALGNKGLFLSPNEWYANKRSAMDRASYLKKRQILLLEKKIRKLKKLSFYNYQE